MATEFNLFDEADSLIKCRLPDGSTMEIDAFELDMLLAALDENERTLVNMKAIIDAKYGVKLAYYSIHLLLNTKEDILTKLKKNSISEPEQSSTTDSSPDVNETTTSFN